MSEHPQKRCSSNPHYEAHFGDSQEWTSETVAELMMSQGDDHLAYEAVAEAYNAAVAKAHQDGWYEGRNYEIKLAKGELAGEREKREQAEAKMFDAYEKAKAMRERVWVSELAAKDNADWFDALCAELRTILQLPESEEVTPIIEAIKRLGVSEEGICGHRYDREGMCEVCGQRRGCYASEVRSGKG